MQIDRIKDIDEHYYMGVFGERIPVAFERGEGICLYDRSGRCYKDFLAGIGVNVLGYSDELFKSTLKDQVDRLLYSSNLFFLEEQAQLAQQLCQRSGYDKVFLGNSGSEVNEFALKLAWEQASRRGIRYPNFVALKNSFRGRTLATSFHWERSGSPHPSLEIRLIESDDIDAVETQIDDNTCGVFIEIIQSERGIFPLSAFFVKAIRRRCDEVGAFLIVDEVQTGVGRAGRFLAQEYCGIKGDIVTLARSLGNGVPVGACLATKEAAALHNEDHDFAFGGNHLACAAAKYVLRVVDEYMLDEVNEVGEFFKYALFSLKGRYPEYVEDVRGLGLMLGLEFTDVIDARKAKKQLFDQGFIAGIVGNNTLRFLPPFIVTMADIEELTAAIESLFIK